MKLIFIIPLLFILISCKEQITEPKAVPTTGYENYELIWSDEFDNESIDLTKWNYETGTGVNGDFGTGQLDYATNRKENANIINGIAGAENGCLEITLQKESFGGRNYTSGRLNTFNKGAWGPNHRIEARVYPKDLLYKGQGFAFWMMPAEKPAALNSLMWPQGGEIDIMEYVGSIPYHNLGSVHYAWWWNDNEYADWNHGHKGGYYSYVLKEIPGKNPGYGGYPPQQNDSTAGSAGFHIYGIEWFDDHMEFYVDNNIYHIHYFNDGDAFDTGSADGQDKDDVKIINGRRVLVSEYSNHFSEWQPFEHTFSIILSAGVGGSDNKTYGGAIVPEAVFPASVYIDWVRVYKKIK